ncbi:MAG: type II toxin-antitoxin system Phd/YefM family antitoxin [Gammaproteobacteria bacterium]|nr:type II toxin-antitoxin system Phd/YefM family antitoxin [Gammaproteobacteria bacterium]
MQVMTATNARKEFFELIKGATQKHKVFHIHHKSGDAVLMSENEYDSLLETLQLLSSPGFKKSIKRSTEQVRSKQTIPMDKVFGDDN